MYSDWDYKEIKHRIRKKEVVLGSILLLFLILLVVAFIQRIKWFAMVCAVLLFVAGCFGFSAVLMPDFRYRSFLEDMESRLKQKVHGTILSVSEEEELRDGAMVYPVHIRLKENEDDHIVYLNASKTEGFPTAGTDVTLECCGRHIHAVVNP